MDPRLLTPRAARRYLGGRDPADFNVAPTFAKGETYYDRKLLDRRLDELAGINTPSSGNEADDALTNWKSRHGAAERRP